MFNTCFTCQSVATHTNHLPFIHSDMTSYVSSLLAQTRVMQLLNDHRELHLVTAATEELSDLGSRRKDEDSRPEDGKPGTIQV